jgi:hypothetical protein
MTRAQFDTYRQSFGAFVSCVKSETASAQCSEGWVTGMSSIIGDDPDRRKAIAANMDYYVDYLRKGGGKAPDCRGQ